MQKKFETFMIIMLALCAVLMLMATANRKPPQAEQPESTVQTTAPDIRETTPPSTEAVPQTTAPGESVPVSQVRAQVEEILDQATLEQTTVTRRVLKEELDASAGAAGQASGSYGYALAELLEDRPVNPVAAFWKLVYAGLYEKQVDDSGELSVTGFQIAEKAAKQYEYTAEGSRQLLTDLLTLAAQMQDDLELEMALLGANLTVEADQIFYSEAEQCRYAYFTCTSDRASYILCFYLRGEAKIEDVEFQLLYLRHADGDAEALAKLDYNAKKQTAVLMAAAELLMTGKTGAGEGQIPFAYEIAGAEAQLERFGFHGGPDRGSLTNYRLKIK